MKISFKHLHIENFFSFIDADIDFNTPGYILVSGNNTNPDDAAKSNGSGKSSIWEAIVWALTGDTIRGCKLISNIHGNNGAYVQLDFTIDENEYKLIRTKDHSEYKTNLKLYINNQDKSGKGIRDTEKILSEYLPDLTASLIGSVIILGQGLPQRFTNNTPSGRKEVLEKLSKSDFMIDDLKVRINNRKLKLSQELRLVEDKITSNNSAKNLLINQINENKIKLETLANIKDFDESIKNIECSINDYNSQIDNLNITLNNSNEEYQILLAEKTNIATQLNDEISKLNKYFEPILNKSIEESSQLNSDIRNLNNKLIELKNITDICPTCGQKIPGVYKPDTSEIESNINILKDNLNNVEKIKSLNQEEKTTKLNDINLSFKTKTDEITSKLNSIFSEITKIKNNISELINIKSKFEQDLNNIKLDKQSYDTKKQSAEAIIASNIQKINEIDEELLYNNNEKSNVNEHLDIINKMNTIITRDFRGYLLTNVITFINNKAKEYSKQVFGTDKLNFEVDGNNLVISYDDKDYSSLSGGERQKLDIIIQFAIRDMLCKYLNFSSNIIVIDEIFDALDFESCQKVLNLISNSLTDVETIYIISHHSDLSIPFDSQIFVNKGPDKISRLTNVIQ